MNRNTDLVRTMMRRADPVASQKADRAEPDPAALDALWARAYDHEHRTGWQLAIHPDDRSERTASAGRTTKPRLLGTAAVGVTVAAVLAVVLAVHPNSAGTPPDAGIASSATPSSSKSAIPPLPTNTQTAETTVSPIPVPSAAPLVAGIIQTHQSPLPSYEFDATTRWQGPTSDPTVWYDVIAGESYSADGATYHAGGMPAVIVYEVPSDPNAPNGVIKLVGEYTDASLFGQLTLTGGDINGLTVSDSDSPSRSATFYPLTGTFSSG